MQHIKTPVDLTSLSCLTKADVQQAIDTAYPFPKQGFIIWSDSAPDVVTTPLLAYFLWGKTVLSVPNKEFYFYNGTSWELVPLVDGNLLANNSIPLGKLKLTGTSAYDIIQVNAANNALIFTSIPSAIQANSIPPAKLYNADIINQFILTSLAGTTAWTLISAFFAAITDNNIPTSKLIHAGADALGLYLRTKLDGSNIEWSNVDVANLAAVAAVAGQSIKRNVGNTGWDFYTPVSATAMPFWTATPTVYSGGDSGGWKTCDVGISAVLLAAKAHTVILQAESTSSPAGDNGGIRTDIRKDSVSSTEYLLNLCLSGAGDLIQGSAQGLFPVNALGEFDYKVTGIAIAGTVVVKMVGYLA